MLRFPCDNCGKIIEDICGEHCESDDEGYIMNYICPHCGKKIIVMRAKKYIEGFTKRCSNIIETMNKDGYVAVDYQPWLTPDEALRAVEIAREEVAKKVLEVLQGDQNIAIINVIMYCNSIIGKED